jgi:hypothetical protein
MSVSDIFNICAKEGNLVVSEICCPPVGVVLKYLRDIVL